MCSGPDCGQIWGQKRFLTRGGRWLPIPARKRFFVREVTRFPAVAGRHPWPPAYPEFGNRHTTFCGTSSRSSESSPWTAVRRRRVPTQGHSLLLQAGGGSFPCDESHACAVCDSNCGLCSIVLTPWQFGPPARVVKETCSLTGSLSAKKKNGDNPLF